MDDESKEAKKAEKKRLRDELMEMIAGLTKKQRFDKQFTRNEAALYLECGIDKLRELSDAKLPPPPVANSANRGKNSGIKYRLSTLMDYRNTEGYKNDAGFTRKMTKANDYEVKRARTEEEKAKKLQEVQRKKAFAKTPFGKLSSAWSISGFLSDDSFAHRQAWLTTEQADNEAAQFAFFVDERGLILGNAWQSAQQTFEMLMSPKTDVVWQTWISALAGVWADESERQRVLMECADIDASVPQLVQDMRDAKLAGI